MTQLSLIHDDYVPPGGEQDYWSTRQEDVEALLPYLPLSSMRHVVEPTAGSGSIVRALSRAGVPRITAVEIQPEIFDKLARNISDLEAEVACLRGDFSRVGQLLWDDHEYDRFIVGNTPYSKPRETIGLELTELCLELAQEHGIVALLLPLDYLTGVERAERLHDRFGPPSVYALRRRFRAEGTTTSGARPVAWLVWRFGRWYRDPTVRVL